MKKNTIRYTALGIAFLLILGVFSMWALSTQESVTVGVGTIDPSVTVTNGANVTASEPILLNSISGEYGDVAENYTLYVVNKSAQQEYTGAYEVTLHIANAAEMSRDLKDLSMQIVLDGADEKTESSYLTLENGKVSFMVGHDFFENSTAAIVNIDVNVDGGSYRTYEDVNEVSSFNFVIDIEEVGRPINP